MVNELQKAIDQIGFDAVRKSIPQAIIGLCDMHGHYMSSSNTESKCPGCMATPSGMGNGVTASDVEHYIDLRDGMAAMGVDIQRP